MYETAWAHLWLKAVYEDEVHRRVLGQSPRARKYNTLFAIMNILYLKW